MSFVFMYFKGSFRLFSDVSMGANTPCACHEVKTKICKEKRIIENAYGTRSHEKSQM